MSSTRVFIFVYLLGVKKQYSALYGGIKEEGLPIFVFHQIIDILQLICPTHPLHSTVATDGGSEASYARRQGLA